MTPKGFRDVGHGPGSNAGEYIEWLTIRDHTWLNFDLLWAIALLLAGFIVLFF
ncbi:MAG: hypothetical protein ACLPHP_08290 [Candidatus Sulfotelmatobacter sp.]